MLIAQMQPQKRVPKISLRSLFLGKSLKIAQIIVFRPTDCRAFPFKRYSSPRILEQNPVPLTGSLRRIQQM